MRFLLSNDDGYQAPGLAAMAEALSELGELVVMAPDRDCSGASHSLTLDRPLRVGQDSRGFYYVNGTPTDCVHLALTGFLPDYKPDMVISGINSSANLGDDVLYSGTVAAALEARFLGCPSLALSLTREGSGNGYQHAVDSVLPVIRTLLNTAPEPILLNINIPDIAAAQIGGYEITRLGQRHKAEPALVSQNPAGETVYWVGPAGPSQDAGAGTDFFAVSQGRVSITPLQFDSTAYAKMEPLQDMLAALLPQPQRHKA